MSFQFSTDSPQSGFLPWPLHRFVLAGLDTCGTCCYSSQPSQDIVLEGALEFFTACLCLPKLMAELNFQGHVLPRKLAPFFIFSFSSGAEAIYNMLKAVMRSFGPPLKSSSDHTSHILAVALAKTENRFFSLYSIHPIFPFDGL